MFTTSCHCGAIQLEIARKPRKMTACNCSICRRYGATWAYFQRKSVNVIRGGNALARYSWRDGRLRFCRCKNCGCVMHHERSAQRADGTDIRGVNMRNVDEPAIICNLPVRMLDGASSWKVLYETVMPEAFSSPKFWRLPGGDGHV